MINDAGKHEVKGEVLVATRMARGSVRGLFVTRREVRGLRPPPSLARRGLPWPVMADR